jgi:small subunit ribosomal protein S8e
MFLIVKGGLLTKWNIERGKKVTGGKIHKHRKKRRFQRGSVATLTTLGEVKNKIERKRSGISKIRLIKVDFVNALNPKTKKAKKVKILNVVEHADNPHYTRRGIITKGCVVKTEIGLVKITSRPSQEGVANGIMIEEKK